MLALFKQLRVILTKHVYFMKKKLMLLLPTALFMVLNVYGYDGEGFSAKTKEGVELYYTVLSEIEKTVKVGSSEWGVAVLDDSGTEINIPSTVNGYTVTVIGERAFFYKTFIESVSLPETIVSIDERAFIGCSSMKNIVLPGNIRSIGSSAFGGCSSLEEISIPDNVGVRELALYSCTGLKRLSIGKGTELFDRTCIQGCDNLEEVFINGCIGGDQFKNFPKIRKAVIGDDATDVPSFAFCPELEEVYIGCGVTNPGTSKFYSCPKLRVVRLNSRETGQTFSGMPSIEEIILGDSVRVISWSAFPQASIRSIEIPDGVTEIGNSAFSGCADLQYVSIGKGLTTISPFAFSRCNSLRTMKINASELKGVYGQEYLGANGGADSLETVIFGDNVRTIAKYAFNNKTKLKSIQFSANLNSIGKYAFEQCQSLTTLNIPDGVSTIGSGAFSGCDGLQEISIGSGLLQSDLTSIFDGCHHVRTIKVSPWNEFYDSRNDCDAIIERATNTLVLGCSNTIIPVGVKAIGTSAFSGCPELKIVVIPDGVESIGSCAFSSCDSLESVFIGNDVTKIKSSAFHSCMSLREVNFGNSLSEIETQAFYGCEGLTSIVLPNSLKSVKLQAFAGCTNLQSLTFGENNVWLDEISFFGANLQTIVSFSKNPKAFASNTFGIAENENYVYNNAILYVPIGTKEIYQSTNGWMLFQNIAEGTPSSVETISSDTVMPHGIYSMSGIPSSKIHKGLNIIRYTDGQIKKLLIK